LSSWYVINHSSTTQNNPGIFCGRVVYSNTSRSFEAMDDLGAKIIQVLPGWGSDAVFRPSMIGDDIGCPSSFRDDPSHPFRDGCSCWQSAEMPAYEITRASRTFLPCQGASPACEASPPKSVIILCRGKAPDKGKSSEVSIGGQRQRVNHHASIDIDVGTGPKQLDLASATLLCWSSKKPHGA
jgi:hypothetical protein